MKTRSNMPLFVVECEDVKALKDDQIELLRCGDYLVKKDASGEHAYKVTFKSDTGMCITYHDASVVETQSYDKVDGKWVYNSEDKSPLPLNNILNTAWEVNQDITITGAWLNGISVKASYSKFLVKNGVAYVVIALTIANETESSITMSQNNDVAKITLSNEIAEKIYRKDGSNLLVDATGTLTGIVAKSCYYSTPNGAVGETSSCRLFSSDKNEIRLRVGADHTITSGTTQLFDFRVFITL